MRSTRKAERHTLRPEPYYRTYSFRDGQKSLSDVTFSRLVLVVVRSAQFSVAKVDGRQLLRRICLPFTRMRVVATEYLPLTAFPVISLWPGVALLDPA